MILKPIVIHTRNTRKLLIYKQSKENSQTFYNQPILRNDSIVRGIVKAIRIILKITSNQVSFFIADVSLLVSLESFNNSSGVDDISVIHLLKFHCLLKILFRYTPIYIVKKGGDVVFLLRGEIVNHKAMFPHINSHYERQTGEVAEMVFVNPRV